MSTVQQWSRRFDWVRLHRWAWDRQLLSKPQPIKTDEQESKQIWNLLLRLIHHTLRSKRISYSLECYGFSVCIEFLQPMQILKQLLWKEEWPRHLQWSAEHTMNRPILTLSLRDGTCWYASQAFLALEQFLLEPKHRPWKG